MHEIYPLDIITVLTIKRAKNRHESLMGAALHPLIGVPPEMIKFVIGIDGKDYENMTAVATAAAEDGFEWVEEYALGTKTDYVQQTRQSVAQIWGYARILRYLTETEQTGLILWDDKMITLPFHFFCGILEHLKAQEKPFYAWQLMLRGTPDEIGMQPLDVQTRIQRSFSNFQAMATGIPPSPIGTLLEEGIAGYEECMVFSPQGANWMLKELEKGVDFYLFLDHFICFQCAKYATMSAKDGKGFYRPMEVGYRFVDAYRPMGSLTQWAHENAPKYHESKIIINPEYLTL